MFQKIVASIPVNWVLLKNPANWIIVFLMVALAGAGLAAIASATTAPKDNGNG